MWYYYISIVSRVLKINNYCIVWCDVLIWYYDAVSGPIIINDIYNNFLCNERPGSYHPYRVESIYRYSGLLYDKLKHIFSYIYRNVPYVPPAGNPEVNKGDHLYYAECRFKSQLMYPQYYNEVCIKKIITVDYLPEYIAQSLYFIRP